MLDEKKNVWQNEKERRCLQHCRDVRLEEICLQMKSWDGEKTSAIYLLTLSDRRHFIVLSHINILAFLLRLPFSLSFYELYSYKRAEEACRSNTRKQTLLRFSNLFRVRLFFRLVIPFHATETLTKLLPLDFFCLPVLIWTLLGAGADDLVLIKTSWCLSSKAKV